MGGIASFRGSFLTSPFGLASASPHASCRHASGRRAPSCHKPRRQNLIGEDRSAVRSSVFRIDGRKAPQDQSPSSEPVPSLVFVFDPNCHHGRSLIFDRVGVQVWQARPVRSTGAATRRRSSQKSAGGHVGRRAVAAIPCEAERLAQSVGEQRQRPKGKPPTVSQAGLRA